MTYTLNVDMSENKFQEKKKENTILTEKKKETRSWPRKKKKHDLDQENTKVVNKIQTKKKISKF